MRRRRTSAGAIRGARSLRFQPGWSGLSSMASRYLMCSHSRRSWSRGFYVSKSLVAGESGSLHSPPTPRRVQEVANCILALVQERLSSVEG
jgi:hypothetical protein